MPANTCNTYEGGCQRRIQITSGLIHKNPYIQRVLRYYQRPETLSLDQDDLITAILVNQTTSYSWGTARRSGFAADSRLKNTFWGLWTSQASVVIREQRRSVLHIQSSWTNSRYFGN